MPHIVPTGFTQPLGAAQEVVVLRFEALECRLDLGFSPMGSAAREQVLNASASAGKV